MFLEKETRPQATDGVDKVLAAFTFWRQMHREYINIGNPCQVRGAHFQ